MALFGLPQRVWSFLSWQIPTSFVPGTFEKVIIKQETTPGPETKDHIVPPLSVERDEEQTNHNPESEMNQLISNRKSKEEINQEFQPRYSLYADDEDSENWSEQELDFFNSINERGSIAMLWSYWKVDFPMLPEELFTIKKEDALIKNWKGLPSTGAKAFNTLIQAGCDARELRRYDQDAAKLLSREINRYIKWSFKDARWSQETYIPLIVVSFVRKREDLLAAETRGRARIKKLSEQYRQLWTESKLGTKAPLPTIFHVLLAKTVMGVESYDSSSENPKFRNLFITDWRKEGHDLWNAMVVAILVEQCRLWLARVEPKRKLQKKKVEVDPDL